MKKDKKKQKLSTYAFSYLHLFPFYQLYYHSANIHSRKLTALKRKKESENCYKVYSTWG